MSGSRTRASSVSGGYADDINRASESRDDLGRGPLHEQGESGYTNMKGDDRGTMPSCGGNPVFMALVSAMAAPETARHTGGVITERMA